MALRMANPWKYPKTGVYYFRKRVPSDLVTVIGKREHKVSLGTKDPATAKALFAEKWTEIEKLEKLARAVPEPLPFKTIVGLAGEAYRHLIRLTDTEPGETIFWDVALERIDREASSGNLEGWYGPTADEILTKHGLKADGDSRERLLSEIHKAVRQGAEVARRKSEGDYSEDPKAGRFPEVAKGKTTKRAAKGLDLEHLLDHKARTTSIKPKTVSGDRSYIRKFVAFVGHGDAKTITKEDVRNWRDSLIEGGLTPKTINDKYISAVRGVLSFGVREYDLPSNVASGIRDNRAPAAPEGSKGYSEDEALKILKATFDGSTKALSMPHRRALFWVPWILAYTGLRVSEVTQFRGRHLITDDGIPHMLITPADGSTKGGNAWAVGIHQHLIELGFLDFVRERGDGALFYEPYPASVDLTAIKGKHRALEASGRITDWIKDELGIVAPLGRPNHAWRHVHTTRTRICSMDKEARDFMLGSRSRTDAREGYGDWPPVVLDREINKLPRFEVKDTGWRP